jgi:hypothetical protein
VSYVKTLSIADVEGVGFLPQAIIARSVDRLSHQLRVDFTVGRDEFDDYVGAVFALDGNLPFTIRHYRGHPKDTATLYLPQEIRDVQKITSIIKSIMDGLKLESDALVWQREDDPDL